MAEDLSKLIAQLNEVTASVNKLQVAWREAQADLTNKWQSGKTVGDLYSEQAAVDSLRKEYEKLLIAKQEIASKLTGSTFGTTGNKNTFTSAPAERNISGQNASNLEAWLGRITAKYPWLNGIKFTMIPEGSAPTDPFLKRMIDEKKSGGYLPGQGIAFPGNRGSAYGYGHESTHGFMSEVLAGTNPQAHSGISNVAEQIAASNKVIAEYYGKLGYNTQQIAREITADLGSTIMNAGDPEQGTANAANRLTKIWGQLDKVTTEKLTELRTQIQKAMESIQYVNPGSTNAGATATGFATSAGQPFGNSSTGATSQKVTQTIDQAILQRVREVLKTGLRGSGYTEEGLTSAAEKYIGGATGRVRVGAGGWTSGATSFQEQIQAAINAQVKQKVSPPFQDGSTDPGRIISEKTSSNLEHIQGQIDTAFKSMDSVSDKTKNQIREDLLAIARGFDPALEKIDVFIEKLRIAGGMPQVNARVLGQNGQTAAYQRNIGRDNSLIDPEQAVRNRVQELLGGNPQAVKELEQRLADAQMGYKNLLGGKINTESKSGRTIFQAKEIDEATGAVRNLTVGFDKLGNVIPTASRQHQGFIDSVVRDTGELIKWSIGIGLVYGSMYKLQQLITLAVENQTKLIDVNVALGKNVRDVNSIFEDASSVAKKTGENIGEVLDTYAIAYRAVGGIAQPMERTTAANQLLTNSTILNKLANISASEAVDTLAGSLRQLAKPGESATDSFNRGAEILDKWVAVSNKANIGLGDLATAFSVTAESALNSGMSVDELNATIAVLSEKIGGLGGKETGNAVRAIIGGVYQQQAVDILNKYGIAVKDSAGEMRNFMSISQDVYDLYKSGIISEGELNKISYVWGGGVRRGQQVVAWMKDQDRMNQITAVSAAANGEAQEALAKKMDSVQTSSVEVSNAFQKFAMALGTEGGLLGAMTGLNKSLAWTVELLALLTKALGSVAIPATLGLAMGLFSKFGRDTGRANQLNAPFAWMNDKISGIGATEVPATRGLRSLSNTGPIITETKTVPNPSMDKMGNWVEKNGMGLAFSFASALPRALEGDIGAAASTFGGGVLGTLLAGGNPVGALIGSAIGDAFYQKVFLYKTDFASLLLPYYTNVPKPGEETNKNQTPEEQRKAADDLFWKSYKEMMGGDPLGGSKFGASVDEWFNSLSKKWFGGTPAGQEVNPDLLTPEQKTAAYARKLLQQNRPDLWKQTQPQIEAAANTLPKVIERKDTEVFKYEQKMQELLRPSINALVKTQQEVLRKQLISGELPFKDYQTKFANTTGTPSTLIRMLGAANNMSANISSSELGRYAKLFNNIGSEEKQILTDLTTQWYELSMEMERTKELAADQFATEADRTANINLGEKRKLYADITQQIDDYTAAMEAAQKLNLPTASLQFMKDYTLSQLNAAGPESPAYQKIAKQLADVAAANGVQSPVNPTASLVIPKDQTNPIFMKADWAIVQYLLGEILKTNEKQLDGIYNLPSGASFYVPYQAWKMDTETRQAGANGATDVNITGLDQPTSTFSAAVDMFGNTVTAMVDIFGRATIGPNSTKNPYINEYGQPLTGPNSHSIVPPDWRTATPPAYVDQYGRPTIGPSGGTQSSAQSQWTSPRDMGLPNSTTPGSVEMSIGQRIMEWLTNAIGMVTGVTGVGAAEMPGSGSHWNAAGAARGMSETNVQPINTNFTLNLNTQTQLIVDGRVLADIIKPYLSQDALTSEGSMGSTVSLTVV